MANGRRKKFSVIRVAAINTQPEQGLHKRDVFAIQRTYARRPPRFVHGATVFPDAGAKLIPVAELT